jgi:predicted GIY-YIG superfamily endonuclease
MSFWVYILQCSDNSYYTGHTEDLEMRITAHQQGVFGGYTSKRLPVKLVFCDDFTTRDDAFARERQIKGWTRRKKQALIKGDWNKLIEYSRGKGITLRQAQGERISKLLKYAAHGELVEPERGRLT